jgi:hypothetical protein
MQSMKLNYKMSKMKKRLKNRKNKMKRCIILLEVKRDYIARLVINFIHVHHIPLSIKKDLIVIR